MHDPLEFEGHLRIKSWPCMATPTDTASKPQAIWLFNPGECAGMMAGRNAIGVVDLRTLECRVLNF